MHTEENILEQESNEVSINDLSHLVLNETPSIFEMSLIGSMLRNVDYARDIAYAVDPSLFGNPRNAHAYYILRLAAMADSPLAFDAALATIDQSPGSVEFYGLSTQAIADHLLECERICEPASSWPQYVKGIELAHARRTMLGAFDEATADAMSASDSNSAVSAVMERMVTAASECRYESSADSTDPVTSFMSEYDDYDSGSRIRFSQSPLNTVGGYRAPNVIVVSAFTGIGKSWLVADWSISAAASGKRVRFYPLEMSRDETLERMMAIRCRVDLDALIQRKLPSEQVRYALDDVNSLPIDIIQGKSTASAILSDVLTCPDKPDIVVIDHLQLLRSGKDKRIALDNALNDFKAAALEHNIAFILVSQLSRPENRQDLPDPTMFMLKESGGIEQIADYIVFLHKKIDRTYGGDYETYNIWTAKQRNGQPAGRFKVEFKDYRFVPV